GIARLRGQINRIQVSRLELPSYAWQTGHQIVVQDAEQKTYQLVREDGRVILSGKVGELAKNDDYQLFVSDLDANSGFAFNISKQSELDAIKWLKDNLSVTERGKQTGIVELSFTGENPSQIQAILDDISQNYF
ncbi:tyrosine-protein kinase, partial [Vibrio anguillarum]|nr:tyrosine-protein kinase [Vibrio anguillarum]